MKVVLPVGWECHTKQFINRFTGREEWGVLVKNKKSGQRQAVLISSPDHGIDEEDALRQAIPCLVRWIHKTWPAT